MVHAPTERRHGAGPHVGLSSQGPRRLARDRRAEHLVTGVTEGLRDRRHHRGLAGPGDAGDQLDALARSADVHDRLALGGGEGASQGLVGHGDRPFTRRLGDRRGVGSFHLGGDPALDHLFGGDHRGGGVGPLGGVLVSDERDCVGMGEHPAHHLGQLDRVAAVEGGHDGHDDVTRGEDLALGEGPFGSEDGLGNVIQLALAQSRAGAESRGHRGRRWARRLDLSMWR